MNTKNNNFVYLASLVFFLMAVENFIFGAMQLSGGTWVKPESGKLDLLLGCIFLATATSSIIFKKIGKDFIVFLSMLIATLFSLTIQLYNFKDFLPFGLIYMHNSFISFLLLYLLRFSFTKDRAELVNVVLKNDQSYVNKLRFFSITIFILVFLFLLNLIFKGGQQFNQEKSFLMRNDFIATEIIMKAILLIVAAMGIFRLKKWGYNFMLLIVVWMLLSNLSCLAIFLSVDIMPVLVYFDDPISLILCGGYLSNMPFVLLWGFRIFTFGVPFQIIALSLIFFLINPKTKSVFNRS